MNGIYPSRLLVLLLLGPCLLSAMLIFDDRLAAGIYLLDAVIVILVLFDFFAGRINPKNVHIETRIPSTWSLGRSEDILIRCEYHGQRPRLGRIRLDLPPHVYAKPDVVGVVLDEKHILEINLQVYASQRGRVELDGVFVEVRSIFGLWNSHYQLGKKQTVFVYPNIKQLSDYALLARTNRLALIGVRKMRTIGGDTDFERLRDYQSDDPIQRIDWKASARRDELIVRDYQPNQSQSIMLMIDAGRMMVTKNEGSDKHQYTMLDHAINASLLLAYVAIKQGDRVGLIAYADGIKRFVPCAGGEKQIHKLIHAVHDVHAELVESHHEEAFLYLQKMERKRSLVVMFSHVLDDVNAMHIEQQCKNLVGRHLPLAVLLRDQSLHQHVEQAPTSSKKLWLTTAAAHICNWRQDLIDRLSAHGSLVLDSDPDDLNAGVISRYLELKAKHLI